jgi:hypothetical protein
MALTGWNVTDGTKRQLFQNPSGIQFYTWPIAPNWRIVPGGQINQFLYADGTTTVSLPLFAFQGLRMYDQPVAWVPPFSYREKPYNYVVPISWVTNTINPPGLIQTTLTQVINNFAFKLRRISFAYHQGPMNTASAQLLGCRLYDWQDRVLSSDWILTNLIDFNARSATGSFIFGPHANFPAIPLLYPVNGRIKIDLTDMEAQLAGSVSDIEGSILFEGVNLEPCASDAPGAITPDDQAIHLYSNRVVYPLPYIYTPNTVNFASNKATFNSQTVFPLALDADSEFWMSAVHRVAPFTGSPT